MILTPGTYDTEDMVMLSYSVIAYTKSNPKLSLDLVEVTRVVGIVTDSLCQLTNESKEEWDGCMWFERFESIAEDSLAASLAWAADPDLQLNTHAVLTLWLRRNGL